MAHSALKLTFILAYFCHFARCVFQPCSCRNSTCPVLNSCKELVKDDCGCCFVCKRTEGEICGGQRNIFGKCEGKLECRSKYAAGSSRNKKHNIGRCEPFGSVCRGVNTGNVTKRIGESWILGCTKMRCRRNGKVLKEQAMCLVLGCGIHRSINSACCRTCKREIPRVICGEHGMLLIVPKSIMSRKSFEKSSLNNRNCQGYENKTHFYFVTSWTTCGTKLKRIGSIYNYTNAVSVGKRGSTSIERTLFSFFCVREHVVNIKRAYRILQSNVQSGVVMQVTSKGGRLYPKKRSVILTNQDERMYVAISAPLVKKYRIRMMLSWCVLMPAKAFDSAVNTPRHILIDKGCIVEKRVKVIFKRKHVIWFSIPNLNLPFKRPYLHCSVIICPEKSFKGSCAKDCIRNISFG